MYDSEKYDPWQFSFNMNMEMSVLISTKLTLIFSDISYTGIYTTICYHTVVMHNKKFDIFIQVFLTSAAKRANWYWYFKKYFTKFT